MEPENLATELTDQERLLLVFGYLGPLALLSLLASRREFVKWHAKQGILLFATWVALYLLLKPIHVLLKSHLSILAELFWATAGLVTLGMLLVMLLCIVRGLEGERFKIPVLGDLVDQF